MQTRDDKVIDELMEQLIEAGPDEMAAAFTAMLNLAMRIERERHVGAGPGSARPSATGLPTATRPSRSIPRQAP